MKKPVIGLSMGDPAGIGPEIVAKALLDHHWKNKLTPVVFGDSIPLLQLLRTIGKEAELVEIKSPPISDPKPGKITLIPADILQHPVSFGKINAECGRAAFTYIDQSIDWAMRGVIDALCTAPIHKESMKKGGSSWLDHTKMLQERTGSPDTNTLFITGNLRIFFLTRHIPFRDVPQYVNQTALSLEIEKSIKSLKILGLNNPTLAVAGLNPHAGDGGLFGREEEEVQKAVSEAQSRGLPVYGPVPADAVFHQAKEGRYDAVIALYHDQGHIAAKTLDFNHTVSLTLGLPFLRTSVDHGTAFDIAGQGIANETSLVEALKVAARYAFRIRKNTTILE
jgi:4-hydroxythreonine-4-phosphate dehydrogenase